MTAMAATAVRRTARVGVRRERHEAAYPLLIAVIALVAIGVVMVYSASSVRSYISTSDPSSQGFQRHVQPLEGRNLWVDSWLSQASPICLRWF